MFDLATQVCFKVIKLEKGIRSIQWLPKDLKPHFLSFINARNPNGLVNQTNNQEAREEGEEETVNVKHGFLKTADPKFTKVLTEDYVLMGFLQDSCLMFVGVNEGIDFYSVQALANQDSFDYIPIQFSDKKSCILIATGAKDGRCSFWKANDKKAELISSFKYNNMHLSCIRFHRTPDGSILCATSSHDRKIIVYEIVIGDNATSLPEVTIRTRLCFK